MSAYPTSRVRDVVVFLKGKKPSVLFDEATDGALPYILIDNFGGSYTSYTNDPACVRCERSDIIIVADGANTGLVSTNHEGYIGSTLGALRPDGSKVNPRYLFFFLQSNFTTLNTRTRGAAVPHLERDLLLDLELVLRPLSDQEQIVGILDEAETLRRLRTEAEKRTDALISSLFDTMFGDPVTNPKGNKVVRLAEVTKKVTDGVHQRPDYAESGVPFISVKDITTGKLRFDDCKYISLTDHERFTKRCKPEHLDILYTKVGATYGRAVLVDTQREFSIYVSVCLIKPDRAKVDPQFLKAAMNTAAVKRQADQRIKGIGVPDLHLDQIKEFLITLPPLELQREFAASVAQVQELEAAQAASRQRLDDLFQSLLHRALQGEL
ncbi:MAG: restriction endonuclease subunit S [Terriglobia bacterium]